MHNGPEIVRVPRVSLSGMAVRASRILSSSSVSSVVVAVVIVLIVVLRGSG